MKCAKCSFDNPLDARFCENCGQPIEQACPSCSQPVSPGMTIPLTAQVQAPPATGQYILKWDLVHEGVTWFSWQGG
jgi:predicted amidophosphoribosyltransferase